MSLFITHAILTAGMNISSPVTCPFSEAWRLTGGVAQNMVYMGGTRVTASLISLHLQSVLGDAVWQK